MHTTTLFFLTLLFWELIHFDFLIVFFNLSIVGIQYYIGFKYVTENSLY